MKHTLEVLPCIALFTLRIVLGGVAPAQTWLPSLQEGDGLRALDAGRFQIADGGTWAGKAAILDELDHVLARRSMADVMADANREGTRFDDNLVERWLHPRTIGRIEHFHVGFRWNAGDSDVTYWWPQGITGSADAQANGLVAGRKLLAVSWHYDGTGTDKGVRISFVDVSDMDRVTYRHVLLVEPVRTNGEADFQPVSIHAGGIVWFGRYLYVADTAHGFRVFDTERMFRVHTGDSSAIGRRGSEFHAFDYKYVLPEVGRYVLALGSLPARFSFVSLDRTTSPPSLLSGEYRGDGSIQGLLLRWNLNAATGRLSTGPSRQALVTGQKRVQGALSQNGRYWLSCSGSEAHLFRTAVGVRSTRFTWAWGAEDLTCSATSGNLWMATEHSGERIVFAVKMADY